MRGRKLLSLVAVTLLTLLAATVRAQPTSLALLVLEKQDRTLAIADPLTLKVTARLPAGEDPHEVVASADGDIAFISNYGGSSAPQHTLSVVDVVAMKALATVDLG